MARGGTKRDGSHRQFKTPRQPGLVTVAGKPGEELPPQDHGQHQATGTAVTGNPDRQDAIVVEGSEHTNYSGVCTGAPGMHCHGRHSCEECEAGMREAIDLRIEGLRGEGKVVPEPTAVSSAVA